MGLANHRKEIKAEISAWSERWREMQITALNFIVRQSGMDAEEFPPAALAVVVASIGRTLVLEQALGTTGGHDEAVALVNRFIDRSRCRAEAARPIQEVAAQPGMRTTSSSCRRISGNRFAGCEGHFRSAKESTMPNPSIKNEKMYEDLRKEGNSKQKSPASPTRRQHAASRPSQKGGSPVPMTTGL